MKKNIFSKAHQTLLEQKQNLSIFSAVDLALLSQKKWFFSASFNQYTELTSAYGLVLDNPKILIVPNKQFNVGVDGFLSIYNKLEEKFSHAIHNKLKGVDVLVALDGASFCNYFKTVSTKKIDSSSTYESVVSDLRAVNFEQVSYVEQPKQFCLKGGIIDIYSPLYNQPARVCLYDGDVSISFYDLATGLSGGEQAKGLVLTKLSTINKQKNILSLIRDNSFNQYSSPIYNESSLSGDFSILDYNLFSKNKDQALYIKDLYFSAYKYNNTVVAPNSYQKGVVVSSTQEDVALERGDVVCHEDFGLGVLVGLFGSEEEFLKINYEDASVQLSVKSLHKLSFVSREKTSDIKLNSLSKKGVWSRQKKRVALGVEEQTKELISFYANKKNSYRKPYVFGGALEEDFLSSFEYQDTPDQALVWKEIRQDLEKSQPMYRLLCGDVGFGKTELSIRASFRVVINGGQVLILAPTSVLANQHFVVFKARLSSFGVVVGLCVGSLSENKKQTLKSDWVEKKIDVLIGTSSVLYDVVFIKHTNLFVVDEEHRFGVKDKEGVLDGFVNKDVLLMSATPIPRSLNLSLSGLNDISTLGSPPVLRKPIQTFVNYFDETLIIRAIEFELSRGGQVFFVHNNIGSIVSIKNVLSRLVPRASIVVAHSKIKPKQLQKNILSFVDGSVDILLCTSIIGSGVDIPNANTIIINSSHRFGLGQLHQIRGRVGRSTRQGYAYMLIPKGSRLSDRAYKRLVTIEKNVSLGSGYHIAKSDLQIRGGGMLFGYTQSGKSFDFGFEFYSKLMSKAIVDLSGSSDSFLVDNFVYNVDFLCVFPEKYIQNSFDRLRNYRIINSLYSRDKIKAFQKGLLDLYGPLPEPALNMIQMRLLAVLCLDLGLAQVFCKGFVVVFSFNNTFNKGKELFKFLGDFGEVSGLGEYNFKDLEQATELHLKFNSGVKINAAFLVDFLKKFRVFYGEK